MSDIHNVRNSGIIVGGSIEDSEVSVTHGGQAGGETDEARLLRQLAKLLADLEASADELPAGQKADVKAETVRLRSELEESDRDKGRISGALDKLKAAVEAATPAAAAAASLATIVGQIADLVTKLR